MLSAMTSREPVGAGETALARSMSRWATACQRRAGLTLASNLAASVLLGAYALSSLGFNFDPNDLFSPDLRFRRMIVEYGRYFPALTDSLLIVIDGETPEATRAAQVALADRLAAEEDAFHRVFLPGEEPFFERTGLLYGSVENVEDFADSMALIQPMLGELAQSPTLPTLTRMIRLGLQETDPESEDAERWQRVLDHFRTATISVFDEFPIAVSWEALLLSDSAFDPTELRVIVADPILEDDRVLAAERPISRVHAVVEELGLGPQTGVRVRLTGYPALNHEEMVGLSGDTSLAGALSFVLVVLVLSRAFRSLRLVVAAAGSLIVGLIWSAAFAGATVVELNPVSITFGVLVIGLGVDFLIHLGMYFCQGIRAGESVEGATGIAARDAGPALALCAVTTAVGFLSFAPTDYRGVSDLGLAASGGMLILLFQTLTLFPALAKLLLDEAAVARLARDTPAPTRTLRTFPPARVCMVFALLAGLAIVALPRVTLDINVIRIRNPDTPSVSAFEDLLDSRLSTPWFLNALAPSLEEADRIAEEVRRIDVVERAITLSDFVPEDQEEKLDVLADVAFFLHIPEIVERPEVSTSEQVEALAALRDFLDVDPVTQGQSPMADTARRLKDALDRFLVAAESDPESALADLESLLLDPLPAQLDRLRQTIEVEAIDLGDLPVELVSRMVADDGHARVQVYPRENLLEDGRMAEFVEAVRPVWGDITGLPVNLVESGDATWSSLRQALGLAVLTIAAMLLVLWRRIDDTLIVLAPLLLAVALAQAATVLLPVSFNFANVIVLPLILGIGVDSGVHLVYRARRLTGPTESLLATTTARAVLFSAITTVASFGTLTLSAHRGVESLGYLLVIGMGWTLAANLILLPALLELRARWRASRGYPDRAPPA